MTKNYLNTTVIAWISIIAMAASSGCDRPAPMEDTEAPEIQIMSPLAGASIESGDSVQIRVIFSENNQLHDFGIWVWTVKDDQFVKNFLFHSHDTLVTVSRKFWFPVDTPTELRLEAEATDHNRNAREQSLTFHLIP